MMAQTSHATMIVGGLLFWLTSIADGIDGEIARVTLSESAFGEQLDTGVDQLTHLPGLIGALIGCWRQGIGDGGDRDVAGGRRRHAARAAVGDGPGPARPRHGAVLRADQADRNRGVRAARETGALPLRAAAAVFILFRREAFSFSFFLVSLATAQRVAIPALIAAGLVVVIVTLVGYGRVLDQALRANFGR